MDTSAVALRGLLVRRQGDRELLAAALEGDAVAFSEIYRRFNARIHGFCLARLGDAEVASDVTQEVFLRVLRSGAADIENPTAWLYAIARNAMIDSQRSAVRTPMPSEIGEYAATVNGFAPVDAHEAVTWDEDIDSVLLAMRAIAPRYRTAIVMRDIKGLSSAEAAAQLRTTTGAMDTLLHRARRALAKEHERIVALPAACARATVLLHESDTQGISEGDRQALEVHLLGCERCRAERSRIGRRRTLQALLPFIFPMEHGADVISRLALTAAHPFAQVAAIGIAVALVAAPAGIAVRSMSTTRVGSPAPRVPASTPAPGSPASRSGMAARLTAPVAIGSLGLLSDAGHGSMASHETTMGATAGSGPHDGTATMDGYAGTAAAGGTTAAGGTGGTSGTDMHTEPAHDGASTSATGSGSPMWSDPSHR